MTHALVAIDGSAPSMRAARRAGELLGAAASYTVLHVVGPPLAGVAGRLSVPARYETVVDRTGELSQRALAEGSAAVGGTLRRLSVRGLDPGRVICEVAREQDADLVVVGSRGAGGLRRALAGSTSLHVVNHARRPVLVVGDAVGDDPR